MSRLYASENPVIEGLRGLAAMLMVATHYAHLITDQAGAWGFASTGVDLFFCAQRVCFCPLHAGQTLVLPGAFGPAFVEAVSVVSVCADALRGAQAR